MNRSEANADNVKLDTLVDREPRKVSFADAAREMT
jgi:hypothetical protein